MSKAVKAFLCGLALTAVIASPACRHKTTPVQPKVQPTETMAPTPVPNVPTTATTEPTVKPNEDFVQTDTQGSVRTENLPENIEEANRVAQERGYIKDAFFGYDESTLSADAQSALNDSATWMKSHPQYGLLIEGHCDERGTEQYNLALGDRRANTAKQYLMTLGVDASRIRTVSYGEERPFDPGHDESAWQKNRRDHLVLISK